MFKINILDKIAADILESPRHDDVEDDEELSSDTWMEDSDSYWWEQVPSPPIHAADLPRPLPQHITGKDPNGRTLPP